MFNKIEIWTLGLPRQYMHPSFLKKPFGIFKVMLRLNNHFKVWVLEIYNPLKTKLDFVSLTFFVSKAVLGCVQTRLFLQSTLLSSKCVEWCDQSTLCQNSVKYFTKFCAKFNLLFQLTSLSLVSSNFSGIRVFNVPSPAFSWSSFTYPSCCL